MTAAGTSSNGAEMRQLKKQKTDDGDDAQGPVPRSRIQEDEPIGDEDM